MAGPFNTHNFVTDKVVPYFGATFLIVFIPLVAVQIICTQLFELVAPNWPKWTHWIPKAVGSKWVKVEMDSHMVLWGFWLAGKLYESNK